MCCTCQRGEDGKSSVCLQALCVASAKLGCKASFSSADGEKVTLAHPEFSRIRELWHPSKNGELQPKAITRSSNKRIWLLCPGCPNCACQHEWRARASNLTTRKGPIYCPFCCNFAGSFCPCKSVANNSRSVSQQTFCFQEESAHGSDALSPSSLCLFKMGNMTLIARSVCRRESVRNLPDAADNG